MTCDDIASELAEDSPLQVGSKVTRQCRMFAKLCSYVVRLLGHIWEPG